MLLNRINLLVACVALMIGPCVVIGVPTNIADSTAFDFRYEMDVAPNNQNLDGNGSDDWFDTGAIPVSGGFATNSAPNQLFRGDFNNSVWRNGVPNGDYTLEFSVQVDAGGAEVGAGTLGLFVEKPVDANAGLRLNIAKNGQSSSSGGAVNVALGGNDNTDGQHVFRVVHQGAGQYFIYRDGVALNGGAAVTGVNNANNNGIFLGDFSGSLGGDYSIDYLRLTAGAFAPAPVVADAHIQLGFDFASGAVAAQNGGVVVDDSGAPGSSFEVGLGNPTYSGIVPPANNLQNATGIGSVDLGGGQHNLQSILTVAESGLTEAAITAAGGVTMEAWINVNSTPGRGTILGIGDAFVLETNTNVLRLLTNSSSNPTPTILIDDAVKANGEWIHLAGVFSINPGPNNTSAIFMNGELIDFEGGLSFIPVLDAVGNRRVTIGTGSNFPQFVFDGHVFEPRISLGALTPDQFTFAQPVPEPGTAVLLVGSSLVIARRRRKRAVVH